MFNYFIQYAHTAYLMYMIGLWNRQVSGSFEHIFLAGNSMGFEE